MITGRSPRERIHRHRAQPVGAGQHHVEHDEVGWTAFDQLARRVAVAGLERVEAVALEVASDDVAHDRLVVDDQHRRHRIIVAVRHARPTFGGARVPSRGERSRRSSRAGRAGSRGRSVRGRGDPSAARATTYISPSWRRIVLAQRKRVSRSPSQSRNPETAKSDAKPPIRAAFTFCPALKRPCGRRFPAEPEPIVVVELIEVAERPAQTAAVAERRRRARARRSRRARCRCGCP